MISISLVSHGQMPLVYRLIESMEQVVSSGIPLEVILTENSDRVIVPPKEIPGMTIRTIVNERSYGLSKNHNQAFQMMKGDFYCVINPDVVFVEDVFPELLGQLESGVSDIVAPLVFNEQSVIQDSFRNLPTLWDLIRRLFQKTTGIAPQFKPGEVIHPDWIAGIFLLMRAATYHQLGGFDERYYLYFEDVDFSCRARLAGLTLAVDTNCKVVHAARRASRTHLKPFLWHFASAMRFFASPVYWESRALSRESE
jgi:N-acetylglucosaminyl-diphospho-decaprenol L-rhamnosyltransferase